MCFSSQEKRLKFIAMKLLLFRYLQNTSIGRQPKKVPPKVFYPVPNILLWYGPYRQLHIFSIIKWTSRLTQMDPASL